MRVLVACEFSAIVRDAFRAKGHDAWSCDVEPTEGAKGFHLEGDVMDILHWDWDLMIAHPPCTFLANSGVRWLKTKWGRMYDMNEGAIFFSRLLSANIPKVAVENPIMHKHAVEIIGRRQDQIIQPWQFGHGETKAICLWLENLPKLESTNIVEGREARMHKMPPSKNRSKERSRFYTGVANAMADQWT